MTTEVLVELLLVGVGVSTRQEFWGEWFGLPHVVGSVRRALSLEKCSRQRSVLRAPKIVPEFTHSLTGVYREATLLSLCLLRMWAIVVSRVLEQIPQMPPLPTSYPRHVRTRFTPPVAT
eukprot:3707963-Pyramimonas_sp.AAC.1